MLKNETQQRVNSLRRRSSLRFDKSIVSVGWLFGAADCKRTKVIIKVTLIVCTHKTNTYDVRQ